MCVNAHAMFQGREYGIGTGFASPRAARPIRGTAMANTILTPSDGKPITTVAELNSAIAQADAETKAGTYEIDLAGTSR